MPFIMTRKKHAGRAMLVAVLVLWVEMALFARNLDLGDLFMLLMPALMMAVPTWVGATIAARAGSPITRGVAVVAAAIVFLLSGKVSYDIITSESSTAGIAFLFWPVIASAVLGAVIAIAAVLARFVEARLRP